MKRTKLLYWIFTGLIVALDSIPAFWIDSPLARQGMAHLGFPDYFRWELGIGKIIGGALLILPFVPARLKSWAYVGFGISMISALIANLVVNGAGQAIAPLVGLVILSLSYYYFLKLQPKAL